MNNDLLIMISAFGKINLEKFFSIYETIWMKLNGEDEDLESKFQIYDFLYNLEVLGHCEVDYNSRLIFVYPPTLLLLPDAGIPKTLLVGGRSIGLLNKLDRLSKKNPDLISVFYKNHPGQINEIFPNAVVLEALDKKYIKAVTKRTKINNNIDLPISWLLINQTINIENFQNSLEFKESNEPNWNKKIFSTIHLHFKSEAENNMKSDLRLVNYINPINNQQQTWLWNKDRVCKVNRDWGRFIILNDQGINVILYDKSKQRLALPQTIRLPKSLARAAALCSGIAPRNTELYEEIGRIKLGTKVTVYEGVSQIIAEMIAHKLKQTLLFGKI